jgi:uncharacterized oligopeptide transporter (OPT) family protein
MPTPERRWSFLPAPDTAKYHLLLGAVSLLLLGPLGGLAGAFMGFKLGFLVGGQVLAGILGSTITYGYGPEGKHGANYIQTMSASVASMASLAVLIQAMVWLDMPQPAAWVLVLYMTCIGMFAIGIGMLYTPVLVDRLQLEYPSGHAVANILRALTDARLLRRSVAKLGGGMGLGVVLSAAVHQVKRLDDWGLSMSTIGAGMIVGSRIALPAVVMAGAGWLLTPHLQRIGWLGPDDPFRKIGFLIALAMIMGAAAVDMTLLAFEAFRRISARGPAPAPATRAVGGLSTGRLLAWVAFWGTALVLVATQLLHQPAAFVLFAMVLSFLFVFVNGISVGITDSNPISSAFVVSVLLMSALGLRQPVVAMLAATVLLVSCTVGVDMQQDRSTGWRLGSNRTMQFRYQAVGIAVGAVLCVALASFFMTSYPVLRIDTYAHPQAPHEGWQSAMTFKFVGAIRDIGHLPPYKLKALGIGLAIGLAVEIARKLLKRAPRYKRFVASGRAGFATDWCVDALLLSSPYATSFGGFIDLNISLWWGLGGVVASVMGVLAKRPEAIAQPAQGHGDGEGEALPADMSTASLIGGGLIAGESIFMLILGFVGLASLVK